MTTNEINWSESRHSKSARLLLTNGTVAATAFAEKLVLEALFLIALGFQPEVRIPEMTRRGATFCGSVKGTERHWQIHDKWLKHKLSLRDILVEGEIDLGLETQGFRKLSLRDIQSPP